MSDGFIKPSDIESYHVRWLIAKPSDILELYVRRLSGGPSEIESSRLPPTTVTVIIEVKCRRPFSTVGHKLFSTAAVENKIIFDPLRSRDECRRT